MIPTDLNKPNLAIHDPKQKNRERSSAAFAFFKTCFYAVLACDSISFFHRNTGFLAADASSSRPILVE